MTRKGKVRPFEDLIETLQERLAALIEHDERFWIAALEIDSFAGLDRRFGPGARLRAAGALHRALELTRETRVRFFRRAGDEFYALVSGCADDEADRLIAAAVRRANRARFQGEDGDDAPTERLRVTVGVLDPSALDRGRARMQPPPELAHRIVCWAEGCLANARRNRRERDTGTSRRASRGTSETITPAANDLARAPQRITVEETRSAGTTRRRATERGAA